MSTTASNHLCPQGHSIACLAKCFGSHLANHMLVTIGCHKKLVQNWYRLRNHLRSQTKGTSNTSPLNTDPSEASRQACPGASRPRTTPPPRRPVRSQHTISSSIRCLWDTRLWCILSGGMVPLPMATSLAPVARALHYRSGRPHLGTPMAWQAHLLLLRQPDNCHSMASQVGQESPPYSTYSGGYSCTSPSTITLRHSSTCLDNPTAWRMLYHAANSLVSMLSPLRPLKSPPRPLGFSPPSNYPAPISAAECTGCDHHHQVWSRHPTFHALVGITASPLPASKRAVAFFATELSRSLATISVYLAAVPFGPIGDLHGYLSIHVAVANESGH